MSAHPITAVTAVVVATAALTGCGNMYPHVKLDEAPTQTASYEARADYYKRHSADRFDGQGMLLHDGTHIYWPEDLKPAVDADSPTGKAIARVEEGRKALEPMEKVSGGGALVASGGLAALTLGLGTMLAGTVTHDYSSSGDNVLMNAGLGLIGLGGAVTLGGMTVAAVAPMFFMEESQRFNEAIQSVVATYPQSLSDRVAIQPDANGRLVDLTVGDQAPDAPKTAGARDL